MPTALPLPPLCGMRPPSWQEILNSKRSNLLFQLNGFDNQFQRERLWHIPTITKPRWTSSMSFVPWFVFLTPTPRPCFSFLLSVMLLKYLFTYAWPHDPPWVAIERHSATLGAWECRKSYPFIRLRREPRLRAITRIEKRPRIALRCAGTALAVVECVTPEWNPLSDEPTTLRRISLPGGWPAKPMLARRIASDVDGVAGCHLGDHGRARGAPLETIGKRLSVRRVSICQTGRKLPFLHKTGGNKAYCNSNLWWSSCFNYKEQP